MNRAVKIALMIVVGVPVAVIVAVVVWLGTVWIAGNYKWGWIEVPVHYRVTFGVEVGGIAYTGSTVVEVNYQQIPHWQDFGPGIAALYKGQAGLLKLPDGKMVCLLTGARHLVYGKQYYSVAAIADRLLSINGSPTGPKEKWHVIHASNATTVAGNSDIPIELLSPIQLIPSPLIFSIRNIPNDLLDPERAFSAPRSQ
jgi:hypothetical protein